MTLLVLSWKLKASTANQFRADSRRIWSNVIAAGRVVLRSWAKMPTTQANQCADRQHKLTCKFVSSRSWRSWVPCENLSARTHALYTCVDCAACTESKRGTLLDRWSCVSPVCLPTLPLPLPSLPSTWVNLLAKTHYYWEWNNDTFWMKQRFLQISVT